MQDQSPEETLTFHHLPVLGAQVLEAIKNLPEKQLHGGLIIDATLGGGGHCSLLLQNHPNLKVIGLDQDPSARAAAAKRLERFGSRVEIVGTNFANFTPPERAILVLAALGVSSPQLDETSRGFSFRNDGPLDMRMNPEKGITAAELIEELDEYTSLSLASHLDSTFDEALAESYGEISMLKWVLGIGEVDEQI